MMLSDKKKLLILLNLFPSCSKILGTVRVSIWGSLWATLNITHLRVSWSGFECHWASQSISIRSLLCNMGLMTPTPQVIEKVPEVHSRLYSCCSMSKHLLLKSGILCKEIAGKHGRSRGSILKLI